jgi:hypothetical protein
MRLLVIGLVVVTALKVWTQDHMQRTVLGDALIGAYRERAIDMCRKQLPRPIAKGATASPWDASSADIAIGNGDVDVALWDTENPLWSKRFRNPNLVLTATSDGKARCTYDVVAGSAMLTAN